MALSNAGSTVSNAFVTQFADDVIHAAQQKTSKLAYCVRTVRNVIGSTYKFNTLSKGGYIKNKLKDKFYNNYKSLAKVVTDIMKDIKPEVFRGFYK